MPKRASSGSPDRRDAPPATALNLPSRWRRPTVLARNAQGAVIFYTAGEIVRQRLGPGYKQGLYSRGWQKLEVALRRHWQAWLDGAMDLPTALAVLADELP